MFVFCCSPGIELGQRFWTARSQAASGHGYGILDFRDLGTTCFRWCFDVCVISYSPFFHHPIFWCPLKIWRIPNDSPDHNRWPTTTPRFQHSWLAKPMNVLVTSRSVGWCWVSFDGRCRWLGNCFQWLMLNFFDAWGPGASGLGRWNWTFVGNLV